MSKSGLRMSEDLYAEQCAKRARWQRGSASSPSNQRPVAAPTSAAGNGAGRPSLPPSAATGHPIAHVFEPATASKYRNVKTNGYASKREAKRAAALKAMEAAGLISDLREQVTYLIVPKAIGADGKVVERAAHYVADFVYRNGLGHEIVEDCKGMRTDVYRLKRKLMLMVHGIRILET